LSRSVGGRQLNGEGKFAITSLFVPATSKSSITHAKASIIAHIQRGGSVHNDLYKQHVIQPIRI
jgi:hypothetical protein